MGLTPRGSPELSVVIAAHNAADVIMECLTALCAQSKLAHSEIIVADSSTDDTPQVVRQFPDVRLLHFAEPLTIPELRGRGIASARGRIIALLDPFAIVDHHWTRQLLNAHRRYRHPVIGGAVDLEDAQNRSYLAWATYINEYGMFMPPLARGAASIVPGCNLSYKREALFDGDTPRFPVFWKTFVNWEIEADGMPLWLEPSVVVRLAKPVPFRDFLASRFDHGRCFAGMRRAGWPWPRRLFHTALSPVLPLVLLWRWCRVYWEKSRRRDRLIATAPLQLVLFGMWAAGEGCGYLCGTGRSCRRLFY